MRELSSIVEVDEAVRAPVALLFKHSTACAISAMAHREVSRLAQQRPEVPVYIIDVHAQRTLSNRVAELFDIVHHSPQAILLCAGEPVWHASHFSITRAGLEAQLLAAGARAGGAVRTATDRAGDETGTADARG